VLRAFGAGDGGVEDRDREDGDEENENGGTGGELRAFGADAGGGNGGELRAFGAVAGGASGVLRAFGADDDVDEDDGEDGDCERRSNTDGRGGKPGAIT
jgi:hypothetical protein